MELDVTQVLLALITSVLGGKFLWDYLKKNRALKSKENLAKMSMQSGDKKELLTYIEKQNSELAARVKALETDLDKMREENKAQAAQIAVLTERLWHYTNKSRGGKKKD